MSNKVHAPLWLRPGGRDLELYERLGGGMLLFRAYLAQLEGARQKALLQRDKNVATLNTAPPLGVTNTWLRSTIGSCIACSRS